MPTGDITARDGRKWRLADAAAVVAASLRHAAGADLPVDYEHQTDYAADNGQPAPAAGWMRELSARADGIWARAEWTGRAQQMLNNREYRYISPTFVHSKSGDVRIIVRAALTNNPALDLPALAKSQTQLQLQPPEESMMDKALLHKIIQRLGLTTDASASAVDKALTALDETAAGSTALAKVAQAIGLADTAKADEVVAKATILAKAAGPTPPAPAQTPPAPAQTPPPGEEYVPRAEFDRAAQALAALQHEQATARATAAVDAAVTAGKITPATRDWAISYASADAEGFGKYVAAAPVILPGAAGHVPVVLSKNQDGLADDEVAICRAMGLTHEQFKTANPAEEVTA